MSQPSIYDNKVNLEIKPINSFEEHISSLETIRFNPTNKSQFITGSHDMSVRLWDVERTTSLHVFTGHEQGVWAVDIHPSGSFFASTGPDGSIQIADLASRSVVQKIEGTFEKGYWLKFSPDGKFLLAAGQSGAIQLIDTTSFKTIATCPFEDSIVYCAKFIEGQNKIACCTSQGEICILNGKLEPIFTTNTGKQEIRSLELISPNKLATSSESGNLRFYEIDTDKSKLVLTKDLKAHKSPVTFLRFDEKADFLYSTAKDSSVFVWQASNMHLRHNLVGHLDQVSCVDVNADSSLVGTSSWDQTAKLFRLSDITK